MAKKDKLKLDNFDFNDGLDLPEFNFGGEKVSDNRKPTTKIKDSIIAGTKQSLGNASTYQKLMRHALPSEYGETFDSADRIGQNMRRIYNEAVKEVKPASADLARAMGTFVPESMSRTKKVLSKVEKWGTGEPELKSDPGKIREDGISLELGKVFKTQFEEDLKDKAEQRSRRKVDDALGVIRHRDQMSMLNQMAIDMRRLAQYETTVTQAFQKKSLELQFRSYYVQADMLELQRKTTIAITSRLDSIAKNTGLPDFVKTRKDEYMKEQLRNNFLQGTLGGLFGNTRDKAERFFENIGRKIRTGASEAASVFSAAAMGGDMAGTVGEMTNESFLEMLSREGTAMAISGQAGKMGNLVRQKMKKHAPGLTNKIDTGAEELRFLRQNGLDSLLSWARSPDKAGPGGIKNTVVRLIKDMFANNIDTRSSETKLGRDNLGDMRNAVAFNQQTQKSITEIIPGFLSRILREITVLRTGDEKTTLVEYDYKGNKFATTKSIVKDLIDNTIKKDSSDYLARNVDAYLDNFGLSDKLKPNEKKALVKHLLTTRFNGGGFGQDTFTDPSKMSGINARTASRISKVFGDYYAADDVDSQERKLIQKRRRADLAEWGHRLGDELNDPRSMIQQHYNVGQLDLLRQAGLVTKDNEINMKAIIDKAVENVGEKENTIHSDMFLKENIKSFNPLKALDSIRNVGVKLWNYKKGSVADDGSQGHIGPMAQDLQSAMGEDVAPHGKKINLANLVSANMAALQGLDQKVNSVGDALKAQVTLVTQYMGGKARSFKDHFTEQSMEQMDHPKKPDWLKDDGIPRSGKDPSFKDRIKTIEELLVMIASNTAAGQGIRFDQMFVRDGKLSKYKLRWPDLFKARRKSKEEEKNEEHQTQNKPTRARDDVLGNISDALHSSLDASTEFGRRGLAAAMKGYGHAKTVLGSFNRNFIKPTTTELMDKGEKAVKTLRDRLNGIDDIYVEGETQPRIYKTKMLQGFYIDFHTGNVIKCIRDIMGPVMDSSDNTIVVEEHEVPSLVLRSTVISKTIDIGKSLMRGIKSQAKDLFHNKLPAGWNAVIKVGGVFGKTILNLIDEPRDVYVQGEDKPRLFKTGFTNGLYFLKGSGILIRRPGQIEDEVIDIQGNILLSQEDISKGLVDNKGEKIASVAKKIRQFSESTIRSGAELISTLLRSGKNTWNHLKKLGHRGLEGLLNGIHFGFGGKESLDVLKQIRDILDNRLPGGKGILGDNDHDGDRDGSWQDIFQNRKGKDTSETKDEKRGPDVKSYRTGNVLDKAQEAVTSLIGNVIDGAAGLLGLGGLFGKGKGKGGETAAKEALKKSGRFAGLLNKIKGFGALGTLGTVLTGGLFGGNILKTAGDKLSPAMAPDALPQIDPSMMDKVPLDSMVNEKVITTAEKKTLEKGGPAAEAILKRKPGILARIHASGMRGVGGVGRLAARTAPGALRAGIGIGKTGLKVAQGAAWGLGKLGTGISTTAKGVGLLGRGALKALPGIGIGYGLYSAGANAMAGNYGSAAADLGLAGVSAFGIGGTLSMLATGGGALAAAMFSPIGLGVIGAAVVGYGLFKAYKWITKKDFSPLSKLRMFQYGIGDKDEKYREQIYNLEKMLQPSVQISGNQAKIAEGKIDIKEVLKIFGIKEDDQESINRFGVWFGQRFKPVYLTYMAAIFQAKGKLNIDLVDTDLKSAKEKLDFLKEVSMPGGPWDVGVLPFPESPKSIVGGATIREVTEGLRKSFESGLKPEDLKEKSGWFKSLFSSEPKDPKGTVTDIKPTENKDELSKKISQAMRSDIMLKGGMAAVSIGSDKTSNWFNNGLITAFDAVRFKAYGLEKTSQALVASVRWLEDAILKDIKRLPNDTSEWSGKPEEMLELSRRFFGFDFNNKDQDVRWINWFLRRFLPIYTTMVNRRAQVIGNDNFVSHQKAFNQVSVEALQICEQICTMASAWRVSDSPWPGIKLLTDPAAAKENIDYIKKIIKDREIAAQKENERRTSAGGSGASSQGNGAQDTAAADKQDLKDSMARAAATKAAIEAGRKNLDAARKGTSSAGDEGEPNQKPTGETGEVSKASGLVSGVKTLAHAGGELSSGAGAEQYLKLKGNATLQGTHPLFLKLLLGAVQEYGEKTGKQVLINEGFRTYAQQQAMKVKYGGRAAAPGSSLHEFGLAVDISSADADAMEKMGLFRKYGLTRPVGAEPWHVEPAGIQLAYNTYKKDWNSATSAIEAGIGRGGGGAGTLSSAPKYGRMPELAKALLQQQSSPGEGLADTKEQMAQAMANQAIGAASASSRTVVQQRDGTATMSGGNSTGSRLGNIQATGNVVQDIGKDSTQTPEMKALLDQISNGEGTTDAKAQAAGFNSAYDVPLSYGRFGKPDQPLSSMSLGQVKDYQKTLLKNSGSLNSSAVGKYQIVGKTLGSLQQKMGLSDDTIFTPQLQDKMAVELLKGRGLNKYMSGKMSARDFQANLYHEWASIAHPDTGKGKQGTGTTNGQIQPLLAGLRGDTQMSYPSNDAGINYIASSSTPGSSISPSGAMKTNYGTQSTNSGIGASTGFESTSRSGIQTVSQVYRPVAPTVARVQPEIRKSEEAIMRTVENVSSILSDSLGVQKSILEVLRNMAVSKNDSAMNTPEKNEDPMSRKSKPIGPSPISVRNNVLA